VVYDATIAGAKRITSVTQSGSLPIYVGVTLLLISLAPLSSMFIDGVSPLSALTSGTALEASVSVIAIVLAIGVAVLRSRFTGAMFLGGVGYAIAVLFALRGAPDLAVTQLLVETLTIVVFLVGASGDGTHKNSTNFTVSSNYANGCCCDHWRFNSAVCAWLFVVRAPRLLHR
jgi:multicomponent Na+:H+ antiporter subunit A